MVRTSDLIIGLLIFELLVKTQMCDWEWRNVWWTTTEICLFW